MGTRVTRAELVEAWGVSRQRIHELVEAGELVEENGTFDAEAAEAVRAAMDIDKVQRVGATRELKGTGAAKREPDPVARTFNMARAQEQVIKAKTRKLEYEIKEGKWVDRELVVQQSFAAAKMLTHRLDAACKSLAPQMCVITNQQEAHDLLVRTLVDGVLANFRKDLAIEHDAERADQEDPE